MIRIDDGTTLDWDRPARVVGAPGHTLASVAVLFEGADALVAGDATASFEDAPMVGVFNADVPQAIATIRRLAALPIDIACFGHGVPLMRDAGARLRQMAVAM